MSEPNTILKEPGAAELCALEPVVGPADEVLDRMIDALESDRRFIYTKINHALWERLVFLDRRGMDYLTTDQCLAARIDRLRRRTPGLVETGFLRELFDLLAAIPVDRTDLMVAAGLGAMPNSGRLQAVPGEPPALCAAKIAQHVPKFRHGLDPDGLQFKRAAINGRLVEFVEVLRKRPFLLVANRDLMDFPVFIGAESASRIEIHGSHARFEREQILSRIIAELSTWRSRRTVVLQAGGALSCWIALRLLEWDPEISVFDLGNALCICNPRALFSRVFGKYYRRQLIRTMERIKPGWLDEAMDVPSAFADPGPFDPWFVRTGRSGALIAKAAEHGVANPVDSPARPVLIARPISFSENKQPDLARLKNYTDRSARGGPEGWGGPITRLLESALHKVMGLDDDKRVVLASSRVAALQAAAGVAAAVLNRRPRLISSAFGSVSSSIEAFSDMRLLDCDECALLDPVMLRSVPADEWDAVLFTNAFAAGTERWQQFGRHCQDQRKILIVDNPDGLQDRPASTPGATEIEVISLHDDKPWGCGEGGAVIVPGAWEDCARDLLQFGARPASELSGYASYEKVSDLSSGAILDRLETMPQWSEFYRAQERRVSVLVQRSGLPLHKLENAGSRRSVTGSLQFLAPVAIQATDLDNPFLVLRKCCRPLGTRHPDGKLTTRNANDLFQRIINVPCHPFVRLLANEELVAALKMVMDRATAGR